MPSDPQPRHILGNFESALSRLRDDLLVMGSLSVRNLQNAMTCLLRRDDQLCRLTIADDQEIDEMEKRIDADGFQIILRFQPVARDLRAVIAAMKVCTNLERLGDLAVSIARRSRRLIQSDQLPEAALVEPLFERALGMIKDSLRAFADSDLNRARDLRERDKELDAKVAELTERLTTQMEKGGPAISDYLSLILVLRSIERAGDHAKNIAEDAIFSVSSEDIRHTQRIVADGGN